MIDFLYVERRFQHRIIYSFPICIHIIFGETNVGIVRRVYGIMRHIEEKRLPTRDGLADGFQRFECQCFCKKCAAGIILFQSRYVEIAFPVVFLCQITGRCTISSTRNVHLKAETGRVGTRCGLCSEVRFAAVDGVITVVFEQLWQSGNERGEMSVVLARHRVGLNAVAIPVGRYDFRVFGICLRVIFQRPVGYSVPSRIHP